VTPHRRIAIRPWRPPSLLRHESCRIVRILVLDLAREYPLHCVLGGFNREARLTDVTEHDSNCGAKTFARRGSDAHSSWKTEIPKALAELQSCCSFIAVALPKGDRKTICDRPPVSVARQFALSPQEPRFKGKEQDPHVDLDSDAQVYRLRPDGAPLTGQNCRRTCSESGAELLRSTWGGPE
jgi:hypothetical protein